MIAATDVHHGDMEWNASDPPSSVPSSTAEEAERSVDDEGIDLDDLVPLERPIETPEADMIDQLRAVPLDEEQDR